MMGAEPLWVPPVSPNPNDREFDSDTDVIGAVEFWDVLNATVRIPNGPTNRLAPFSDTTGAPRERLPSAGRPSWYSFQLPSTNQFTLVTWPIVNTLPNTCFLWARGGCTRNAVGTGASRLQFGVFGSTEYGHVDPRWYAVVGSGANGPTPDDHFVTNSDGDPRTGQSTTGTGQPNPNAYEYMGLYRSGDSWTGYLWNDASDLTYFAAANVALNPSRIGFRCYNLAGGIHNVDFIRQADDPSLIIGG
jgi:hypothetical protein